MDKIWLADKRFYVTTLSRKDKNIILAYHEALKKDVGVIEHLKSVMADYYAISNTLDLPVFFKSGSTYQLVSRYWLLSFLLDGEVDSFPAIIFEDESLIPYVSNNEKIYLALFNRKTLPVKPASPPAIQVSEQPEIADDRRPSDATNSRHKSKRTGRICPSPGCTGTLLKGKKMKSTGAEDVYQVTCYYKSRAGKPCPFHALLTKHEHEKFKKFDLRTIDWLTLLPGRKCPKCHGPVYQRTVQYSEDKVEVYERCAQQYLEKHPKCDWLREKIPVSASS